MLLLIILLFLTSAVLVECENSGLWTNADFYSLQKGDNLTVAKHLGRCNQTNDCLVKIYQSCKSEITLLSPGLNMTRQVRTAKCASLDRDSVYRLDIVESGVILYGFNSVLEEQPFATICSEYTECKNQLYHIFCFLGLDWIGIEFVQHGYSPNIVWDFFSQYF